MEEYSTLEIREKFQKLIEEEYLGELMNQARTANSLSIDFNKLIDLDPMIAAELLDNPQEIIKCAEMSLESFELDIDLKNFRIRFFNLPESSLISIRDLRAEHLGKFIWLKGIVRQKSDVRPKILSANFSCPSCGNTIKVIQTSKEFKEPNKCGCGRKGKFKLESKELIDAQNLVLEELSEESKGQPKKINIALLSDLVSPVNEQYISPGTKVFVVGLLKETPVTLRTGGKGTNCEIIFEANKIGALDESLINQSLTEEDIAKIIELSKNTKVFDILVESIIPNIYGHEEIKKALVLQQFGGVRKVNKGSVSRGDIHVILVGDPSCGKSQMLKRMSEISPRSRFASGKSSSSCGLTATVSKDEILGGWSLSAGQIVLADGACLMLDECEKMDKEDLSSMHTALSQQIVVINKANISASLQCRTSVLAAANPKYSRFDHNSMDYFKQIDLPSSLLSRFDLIFVMFDMPNKEKDDELADFILNLHANSEEDIELIPDDLLRKYIAYTKKICKPKLTPPALTVLKAYYLRMRDISKRNQALAISARQLEGLIRLSEASAKVRLSEEVTKEDAERAIELAAYCLKQVATDSETGKLDIDMIESGTSSSQRKKIGDIMSVIRKLGGDKKEITPEEVIKEMDMDEDKVKQALEKLKRIGDIFNPRPGTIKIMPN